MTSSAPPESVRVLVVGGGPVGMLLAAELTLQGVRPVVVEARETPLDIPRAGTLHARTVQSMLRRGYLKPEKSGSLHQKHTTRFHFAGLPVLRISVPTAEGPPLVACPQSFLERAFEARARMARADIRRGHLVRRLRRRQRSVEVTVTANNGTYLIDADYVVGCDGARSLVRTLAGFRVRTTPATFSGLIGQVRLLDPDGVPDGWTCGADGWTLINVNPSGQSRILTHDFTRPLPPRHSPVRLDTLHRTTERILGHRVSMDRPTHLSRFSDFSSLAEKYRRGRVLLAGDAAHFHAPLGGQGLNTGLQDAFNLGWKLASVVREDARERLLDTYTEERRPVAERVVANTRIQACLMRLGAERDPLSSHLTGLLRMPEVGRRLADEITGQDVAYRKAGSAHPRQGEFLPNHRLLTDIGTRTVADLLGSARPLLLLTPEADGALDRTAKSWSKRLVTVRVRSREPLCWSALLCRPDGYVAWAAHQGEATPDALVEALTEWFGPAMPCRTS